MNSQLVYRYNIRLSKNENMFKKKQNKIKLRKKMFPPAEEEHQTTNV